MSPHPNTAAPSRDAGTDVPTPARRRDERTAELLAGAAAQTDAHERRRLLDEVVVLNMPAARAIARRFQGRGVAADDLEQVACVALVQAARRFDPSYGKPFMSFAAPYMRGEIKKYFRDHGWMVKPSRSVQELQAHISAVREQLDQQLGRSPRPSEIAQALDVDVDRVIEAMSMDTCYSPRSLDRTLDLGGDLPTLGDAIADEHDARPAVEARVLLGPLVRELDDRDRRIIEMRFFEDRTQQEIGDAIGVTQMHVSRLLKSIYDRLRERIGDLGTAPPWAA